MPQRHERQERQPLFYSGEQLARLVGVSYRDLMHWLKADADYVQFHIPKRSGGVRVIERPPDALLSLQRSLDAWMRKVYRHPRHVHGFVRNRSIVTNATEHVGQAYVLNVDIKDFFATITFQRVVKAFQRPPFSLHTDMAKLIASLCCYQGVLPQGAPTSPCVSNIVSWPLDDKLVRFAKKQGYVLTRYADDITISSPIQPFPLSVIRQEGHRYILGEPITSIINKSGFQVNFDKVHLRSQRDRQLVTGIVVNEKTNVTRQYVNQIRAMMYSLRLEGEEAALQRHLLHREDSASQPVSSFTAIVRGKIEFVGLVRGKKDTLYRRLLQELAQITSHSG